MSYKRNKSRYKNKKIGILGLKRCRRAPKYWVSTLAKINLEPVVGGLDMSLEG
jgi:hypothetical protein